MLLPPELPGFLLGFNHLCSQKAAGVPRPSIELYFCNLNSSLHQPIPTTGSCVFPIYIRNLTSQKLVVLKVSVVASGISKW